MCKIRERRNKILELLTRHTIKVSALAKKMRVSEGTIRSDISALSSSGKLDICQENSGESVKKP